MPHARKYPEEPEVEYVLSCTNCGYKWVPNPTRWGNWRNEFKLLPCPNCGRKNRLRKEDVMKLIVKWGMVSGHNIRQSAK